MTNTNGLKAVYKVKQHITLQQLYSNRYSTVSLRYIQEIHIVWPCIRLLNVYTLYTVYYVCTDMLLFINPEAKCKITPYPSFFQLRTLTFS